MTSPGLRLARGLVRDFSPAYFSVAPHLIELEVVSNNLLSPRSPLCVVACAAHNLFSFVSNREAKRLFVDADTSSADCRHLPLHRLLQTAFIIAFTLLQMVRLIVDRLYFGI